MPLCVGMALISMVEVLTAGRSAPLGVGLVSSGFLGGAFAAVSLDIERWGMSLILLYRDCLRLAVSNMCAGVFLCVEGQDVGIGVGSRWRRS